MALRMVSLNRAADKRWFARKGIPEDIRDDYARLYGVKREAQLKLPADTPRHEAKTCLGEWEAEIETRIATLRAKKRGDGRPLTKLNAVALAGRWYTWFIKQHEEDPGSPKRWKEMGDHLVWNVLHSEAPEEFLADTKSDPQWDWSREPDVREAVRPQVAEMARVATFLASEGMALNASAYALFVDAVQDHLLTAISVLERRAKGDYSYDDNPETFPPFTDGPTRSSGIGCWELFEAYVHSVKPAPTTVARWRAVFLQMQRDFAEVGAEGISEEAARTWVRGLVTENRRESTVREVWLSASRTVFAWGKVQKHVKLNPFAEVRVDVPRRMQHREDGKSFNDAEVSIILKASLTYSKPITPTERARRWVPWLCAYSGARPGEITQLRGRDIDQRAGSYIMKLTPDAGTVKTGKTRLVPLHEHLITQGFIKMVDEVGAGALFYNDKTPQRVSNDPLKPSRSRAATARAQLGDWVRKLGVNDPELSPNHAWRHTFKRIAEASGITEKIHDAITGHAPATEGRRYGEPSIADKVAAMRKFPRYNV